MSGRYRPDLDPGITFIVAMFVVIIVLTIALT